MWKHLWLVEKSKTTLQKIKVAGAASYSPSVENCFLPKLEIPFFFFFFKEFALS